MLSIITLIIIQLSSSSEEIARRHLAEMAHFIIHKTKQRHTEQCIKANKIVKETIDYPTPCYS